MAETKNWTILEGGLDRDDVRELLTYHFSEMRAGSPPDACHVLEVDRLADPSIRLFSLRDDSGDLLGVGALQRIGEEHGELKSMRTAPEALGLGVGRAMLHELMETARAMGLTRLSLETGNSALFDAANRLYTSAGFERCDPFGSYSATPFTHFYTREI